MPENKPATLQDILQYTPDDYFSNEEIELLRNTFKYNPKLLKVLRKVFLPTISDPEMPVEQFANDLFLAGRQYSQIPDAEVKSIILAREDAIKFIAGGLIRLKTIALMKDETEAEAKERAKKDSVE